MRCRTWLLWLSCTATTTLALAADLTDNETRWLKAALPVLDYARQRRLPIDIVVQPQDAPGQSPLALAWLDGRCKLVLSMRGNPLAATTLDGVGPALATPIIETVVAHEIGHCWRHVQGAWSLPPPIAAGADAAQLRREIEASRREEAYADFVGLAWTLQRRPEHYALVHAWLQTQRSEPGTPHDTRAWLRLVADGSALRAAGRDDADLFERALLSWQRALVDAAE